MTEHDEWPQFNETEPWHPAFLEDPGYSRTQPGGEYSGTERTIDPLVKRLKGKVRTRRD